MGLLDFIRRKAPVATPGDLETFLDGRGAFLVQKIVWEYSRARSAVGWQQLFAEPSFQQAMDAAVWSNYPLTLSFVSETALVILRRGGADPDDLARGLVRVTEAAFERHPVPGVFQAPAWRARFEEIADHLARAAALPPKPVRDIPVARFREFFDNLPVHPELRRNDFASIQNGVKAILCNIHDELERQARPQTLVPSLVDLGRRHGDA